MLKADVIIFGGGVAGLWTLNVLVQHGYNAILFEKNALGSGQTIKSQGIIHGGLKYVLNGILNKDASALQDMPAFWQQCLQGTGELDLSIAKILAYGQLMWSVTPLIGSVSTLFASNALHSHVQTVHKDAWPECIKDSPIKSNLYQLAEIILDVPSLLQALVTPIKDRCFKIDDSAFSVDPTGAINSAQVSIAGTIHNFAAQIFIFTAGAGNQNLTASLPQHPAMQRRPLQMVMVKSKNLPAIYGHCIGVGSTPRITVTTHTAKDGTPVWYLGGKLAEDGAQQTQPELLAKTKQELKDIFPALDLTAAQFATLHIDRAEEKQANGSKPNSTSVFNIHNYITAWPTKLALAPILSAQILDLLQQTVTPTNEQFNVADFPKANIATPIWDELF